MATNKTKYSGTIETERIAVTDAVEASSLAVDADLLLKPKGTGKVKFSGSSYTPTVEKILALSTTGQVSGTYDSVEAQVAVPATLTSSGTPGTWATDGTFFYFCTGATAWVKMATDSQTNTIMEVYVAVPATPTSTGKPGQRAYDSTNALIYECVATNTWVRHTVTTTW